MFYLALVWAAAQVLPPAQVGLLLVCGSLPRALVLLFGGVLVDRVGPKRVIIASDSVRTLIMVCAALTLLVTAPGPLLLLVLAVVFGVVDGFFLPAVGSVPAFVAAPETMARLQALRSLVYRGAPVLGAGVGGWLIASGSIAAAFVFNAAVFAFSVAALAITRMLQPTERADGRPDERPRGEPGELLTPAGGPDVVQHSTALPGTAGPPGGFGSVSLPVNGPRWWGVLSGVLGEAIDGLRTAAADPFLRVAVLVVTLLDLGLAGPMTAGPALVASTSGWGADGAGALLAAMPAGAAACAAVLIVRRPTVRAGVAIAGSAALTAVGLLGVGVAVVAGGRHAFVLAVASCALVGVAVGVYGTMINTALIQLSPVGQLGRVFAVVSLASYVGDPLSLAGTGALEGIRPGYSFIAGSVLVAAAAILAAVSAPLRTVAVAKK